MGFAEVFGIFAKGGEAGQFEAPGASAFGVGFLRLGDVATAHADEPLFCLPEHGTKFVAQHAVRATNNLLRHY